MLISFLFDHNHLNNEAIIVLILTDFRLNMKNYRENKFPIPKRFSSINQWPGPSVNVRVLANKKINIKIFIICQG